MEPFPLPVKEGKKLRNMKADLSFFFLVVFSVFFFLFKFLSEGNEMKKQKCNGLPAFNSYPVASYISKAATSVPFK